MDLKKSIEIENNLDNNEFCSSKQIIFDPFIGKKNNGKNKKQKAIDIEMDNQKMNKKNKKRVVTENWNLPTEYLHFDKQWELIQKIYLTPDTHLLNGELKTLYRELERKIYGYKQQDLDKNFYDSARFLSLENVLEKMINEKMKCFYCFEPMYVLYEIVRESKQWSVDRINNYQGHNKDNFVLACLECNLKRRRRSSDKYLFTKQLSIIKKE